MKRRKFLQAATGSALLLGGTGLWPLSACEASGSAPGQGRQPRGPGKPKKQGAVVGLARGRHPGPGLAERAQALVAGAVTRAVGPRDPAAAWRQLFSPADVVGIKVNALGGRGIAVSPEVVRAVADGLLQAGLPPGNIVIWDRSDRELEAAGLALCTAGAEPRCYGTDNPLAGGYEPQPSINGAIGSCFSKILTRRITALINLAVLKDHDLAGVSLSLKNLYGAIHNPNKYHDQVCDPYLADLLEHPFVRDKQRLVIVDGLRGQCQGGPAFAPQWQWPFGGVIAGTDPVAVDRIGTQILEARRAEVGLPSLAQEQRAPLWLETATRRGLGQADRARITLREATL